MRIGIGLILRQLALLGTVALAVFLLMKASPIDPIDAYLGAAMAVATPEQKAQIAQAWGLDQPLMAQFFAWGSQILRGELGFSHSFHAPVSQVIADRLGPSLALVGGAWLLSGILGFGLGLLAAMRAGGWVDRIIRVYCYLLAATPSFWLAMGLLMLFSVRLGWTPICCAGPVGMIAEEVSLWQKLHHLLLPLLVLTLFGVAQIALHSRVKLIEILQSDYVLFARAQGASDWEILRRHGLRNAALPALAALMASSAELIGGSILAEQVFVWPGLGHATVEAGFKGDVPLLLAITLLTVLVVANANLLADVLARRLDPKLGHI